MEHTNWNTQQSNRRARQVRAAEALGPQLQGKTVAAQAIGTLLHAARVHDLHMVQSVLALPEHLDLFENGIASRLDFSFSGQQAARLAKMVSAGQLRIGAIHTYLELFARYFVDLTPRVSLVCAQAADAQGNLYTGPNTEDTPAIVEATAFRS